MWDNYFPEIKPTVVNQRNIPLDFVHTLNGAEWQTYVVKIDNVNPHIHM